jgi:hypothetical protein
MGSFRHFVAAGEFAGIGRHADLKLPSSEAADRVGRR